MLYKAKVAVCSEIRKKHSTQSEHGRDADPSPPSSAVVIKE
jgi:hypothetical protein